MPPVAPAPSVSFDQQYQTSFIPAAQPEIHFQPQVQQSFPAFEQQHHIPAAPAYTQQETIVHIPQQQHYQLNEIAAAAPVYHQPG